MLAWPLWHRKKILVFRTIADLCYQHLWIPTKIGWRGVPTLNRDSNHKCVKNIWIFKAILFVNLTLPLWVKIEILAFLFESKAHLRCQLASAVQNIQAASSLRLTWLPRINCPLHWAALFHNLTNDFFVASKKTSQQRHGVCLQNYRDQNRRVFLDNFMTLNVVLWNSNFDPSNFERKLCWVTTKLPYSWNTEYKTQFSMFYFNFSVFRTPIHTGKLRNFSKVWIINQLKCIVFVYV